MENKGSFGKEHQKARQVQYLSAPEAYSEKERQYLELRHWEGRMLSDEDLRLLPAVLPTNPYAPEWAWRKRSFDRFLAYLSNRSKLRILDLGCGNGWMANRLAENPDWEVWAVDLNQTELEQGARLFGRENLTFVYADVLHGILPEKQIDVVVLAGAVQYFPDLKVLVAALRKLLSPKGEIHILDTPFYKNKWEKADAQQRTLTYYTKAGAPQMAAYYHHHLWEDAKKLGAKNLNHTLKIRLLQKIKWFSPFPWLRLRLDRINMIMQD